MPQARRRPYAPRMPPDARREQLLNAAMTIIARDGYASVSIDAIAREANVTRPVVYGVFDGLGALLYALLDRQEERALAQLMEALPTDLGVENPDAFLVAAVRRLAGVVAGDPLTWRPILLSPEGTPTAVRERIARDREVVRARIEGLLAAGLALRGGPSIDTYMASHALIGVAEHFGRLIVDDPEGFDTERLVSAVESLLAALRR
jgi:AcrR family transcriptional regulator